MNGIRSLVMVPIIVGLFASGCGSLKRFAYEGWGRDGWQQPARVVEALQIAPGTTVADLGAGGGYFTFRLAAAVGAAGKVYAVDVDQTMIDYLQQRSRNEGIGNVETVLAAYDDPKLPPSSVDLLFTCNTYHHLEDRTAYFARVKAALRPSGRVAIIEYGPHGFLQRFFGHSTLPETIQSEMEAAGYRLVTRHEFLERQSFLVFVAG